MTPEQIPPPPRIKAWPWNGKKISGQWHVAGLGETTDYVRGDLFAAQAAELATLRAERDGSAGVRIQDIAQYLLDHLPSYADHPAWDAMQDAVDDGLDEDDCIRAWLRALAQIGAKP